MKSQVIEKFIQGLKRESTYRLDPELPASALIQILGYRGMSYFRGFVRGIMLNGGKSHLFLGRSVKLIQPQLISVGRSVIIEDQVTIDALSLNGVRIGNNVTIGRFAIIQCTGVIRSLGSGLIIGDNSAIGAFSFLGAQGGIDIGSDVIIGPRVSFHSENHIYSDPTVPIRLQGESRQGIRVENNVWIGAGSILLDGVRVGTSSVVAAGSVVTKNVLPFTVVAGNPAKVIKKIENAIGEQG